MEKYSFLISVYANENPKFLESSLNSMVNQTRMPDEIVLVKDGPLTDALEKTLDQYDNEYPGLFQFIKSEKNIGLGAALNLGLGFCKNELVARMDSDDIAMFNRCEKQLDVFENDKEMVIVGSFVDEFVDNPEDIISTRKVPLNWKEIYAFGKRRSPFNHPTVMYKKSKVIKCGGYSKLKRNQDVDLFGRMLFRGNKASNINETLLLYRSNGALLKRRKSWENTISYIKTIKKFWKMGYSSFLDYMIIVFAQMCMFLCPLTIQSWLYRKYLRG